MTGPSILPISRGGSVTVPADFCGNHFNNTLPVAGQYKTANSHDAAGCDWFEINTANGVRNSAHCLFALDRVHIRPAKR